MNSFRSCYYPIKSFAMCGSLKHDLVVSEKGLDKNGLALLRGSKNVCEALWMKLTDNPNSGQDFAEITGSDMVSRK